MGADAGMPDTGMPDTGMAALTEDLGFLLARVSGQVVRATNAALAGEGLRVRQYSVLTLACGTPGGLSQRDLAQSLGLDPSQVVALVDELAEAGLVERRPAAADRRTRIVAATRAGRDTRARAAVGAEQAVRESLRMLTGAEKAALRRLLSKVVAASGEPDGEHSPQTGIDPEGYSGL